MSSIWLAGLERHKHKPPTQATNTSHKHTSRQATMHQLARLGVIFSLKRYRLLPKKIRRIYINN
ncbi:MAG: hypothetical protein KA084_00395 [Brachymonas sp.]|nr:hypothetical protein [Brachymonas sp.]MBP7733839.1 hypothetical protein [Brachymonas sp.]